MSQTSTSLDFSLALMRAAATVTRKFDGRLGTWHGISFADFAILLELDRAPDSRMRRVDMAERLGLTPSAVTRALIPLEKIGLVSRKSDPVDARVGYAMLTAAGRRLLNEALESAEMISQEIAPGESASACARTLERIAGAPTQRSRRL